jgi:hypothetical protein
MTWLEVTRAAPVGNLVVYDRIARAVAYRIPESAAPGGFPSVDLQEDGKIVVAYRRSTGHPEMRVAWASVEEPRLHPLSLAPMHSYHLRIHDNEIAFDRGQSLDLFAVPLAEVGIVDLAGHSRLLTREAYSSVYNERFDFDGDRLVWAARGCRDWLIETHSKQDRGTDARRKPCALRFKGAARRLGRGRLRVAVRCIGSNRCDVRNMRVSRRGRLVGQAPKGGTVSLTPYGRQLLTVGGSLKLRAVATVTDDARRQERRHGSLRVGAG